MKRAATILGLWLLLLILFSSACMPAIPPGGTGWPIFLLVPAIPAGAIMAARHPCRFWLVLTYAVIAGSWFAFGVTFTDPAWQRGGPKPDEVPWRVSKFSLIALVLSSATVGAWWVRRRWISKWRCASNVGA